MNILSAFVLFVFLVIHSAFCLSVASAQSFWKETNPVAWATQCGAFKVADFNGNGIPDIAATYAVGTIGTNCYDSMVVILDPIVSGSGVTALPTVVYSMTTTPLPGNQTSIRDFITLDFDGDLDDDIIFDAMGAFCPPPGSGTLPSDAICYLENLGNGTFSSAPVILIGVVASPVMSKGDFNGDQADDLIVRSLTVGTFPATIFSNPSGVLSSTLTPPMGASFFVIVDVNGDGCDDLAYPTPGFTPLLSYAFGNPSLALSQSGSLTFLVFNSALNPGVITTASGDFNNDGILDVANALSGASLQMLIGSPTAFFSSTQYQSISTLGAVRLVDLDLDGFVDLLGVSNQPSPASSIVAARNLGNGQFGAFYTLGGLTFGTASTITVDAVDFDFDSDPDLFGMTRSVGAPTVELYRNEAIFGGGCAGPYGTPIFLVSGASPSNLFLNLGISGAAPSSAVFLGLSTTAIPQIGCGVAIDTSPGALILVNGQIISGVTSANGAGSLAIPIPANVPIGVTFAAQWFVLEPLGALVFGTVAFSASSARVISIF